MEKIFRGIVLFTMILLIQVMILPTNEANAEQLDVTLTELNIKVMPEFINPEEWDYDLPSLLVGYHGTFTNHSDTAYDGELKVSVPTQQPYFKEGFVAKFIDLEEDVNPVEEDFTVNVEEQTISWTPKTPIGPNENYYFVVEYYTGSIEGVTDRSFSYEYTAETDLEKANIEFYIPFRAEDFEIDKEPDVKSETYGLQFYMYEYSDVKQGDVFDFSVTYKKDDIVTTMEAINEMQAPNDDVHAGMSEQGESEVDDSEPFLSTENVVLIVLALIIVGIFVFIVIRGKRSKKPASKQKGMAPKKIVNKEAEIKKLRKMLADGHIDEKTYKQKRTELE